MDCMGLGSFTIVWEDQGNPIRMKGYSYSFGYSPDWVLMGSTVSSRLPDVAMNSNAAIGSYKTHIAYIDTLGANPIIYKYSLDFFSLWTTPTFTIEDALVLGVPFSNDWDKFQLKIDAPDLFTTAQSNWAYTYFNDDANNISVRTCNWTATPIFNSYVVNNGTQPTLGGGTLTDLTTSGNAFPSITYTPDGSAFYVGWFSSYDPGAPYNPMYQYTPNRQAYVSVVMDHFGTIKTNSYSRLDNNYNNNYIGSYMASPYSYTGWGYPKMCFSKHNNGSKLFTLFASHAMGDIWPYAGGTAFLGKYYENPSITAPTLTPVYPCVVPAGLNYNPTTLWDVIGTGTSVFLSQKTSDWYSGAASPLFRIAGANTLDTKTALQVSPNPFSQANMLAISGGDNSLVYEASLYSIEGKQIAKLSGLLSDINSKLKNLQIQQWATGNYTLKIHCGKDKPQVFKLIKE
jgi:hypothetical protein